MCRIDDADPCDFYRAVLRRACKGHTCAECSRIIQPGEQYEACFVVFEGQPGGTKTCAHCSEARKWLERECGGFLLGQVLDELREHWQEEGVHTRELARLIWGMRRRWRRRDGRLMELPAVRKGPCL